MAIEFSAEHIGAHDKTSYGDEQAILQIAQSLATIKNITLEQALLELGYQITED